MMLKVCYWLEKRLKVLGVGGEESTFEMDLLYSNDTLCLFIGPRDSLPSVSLLALWWRSMRMVLV